MLIYFYFTHQDGVVEKFVFVLDMTDISLKMLLLSIKLGVLMLQNWVI